MIPTDPMQKVAMPRLDKTILPAFAAEDVKRLLAACSNDCDRALVLCLLATGCRAAEFVNLTIRDVEKKRHGMGFVRPQSVSVPHQGFLARRLPIAPHTPRRRVTPTTCATPHNTMPHILRFPWTSHPSRHPANSAPRNHCKPFHPVLYFNHCPGAIASRSSEAK